MLNIIFRVDSSNLIGTGHIFRCLNLANIIENANIEFIFKDFENNSSHICKNKYKVHLIKPSQSSNVNLNINSWLGDTQINDAKKIIKIIKNKKIDWLFIDHYNIHKEWEDYIRPYVKKIFVIDDYTNRPHNCDILLNQQIENDKSFLYKNLLPLNCKLLLGRKYILLKKEYINSSKLIVPIKNLKRINIFMGGGDPSNETLKIMKICNKLNKKLNNPFIFDVIVGSSNKNKKIIKEYCKNKNEFNFYFNINYMEKVFSQADLAIGACGGTTYERCIMRLPSLILCIADNQKTVLQKFIDSKVINYIGNISTDYTNKLINNILFFYNNPNKLIEISNNCYHFFNSNMLKDFKKNINNILINI